MLRDKLEDYLDGSLESAQAQALVASLATDPAAAKLLRQLKSERALRAAAYASYTPTQQESSAMASRLLEEAYHQPLGRVGNFIRHGAAVAAAVLVVAGSFFAGHMTGQASAPTRTLTVYTQTEPQVVYRGVYEDARGSRSVSTDFRSAEEMDAFFNRHGNMMPPMVPAEMRGQGKF